MIKSLCIKNYILIDEITIDFNEGFNVFTGETGAGKSIIIGAIDTVLGAKTSKDCIKSGCNRAYLEICVCLKEDFDKTIFTENGIDIFDNEIIISKEITNSSIRSRINGVIVTRDFVKEIREKLLDIHTQHQSYNYVQPKNHIILLDNFADKPHRDNVLLFKEKYFSLCELKKQLAAKINEVNSVKQKEDFLKFQIEEIETAQIEDVNECNNLEKELEILSNIEKIKELSYSSYWLLNGEDKSIIDTLGAVKSNLSKLARLDEEIFSLEEDFNGAYETLKEISAQLRDYSQAKENDDQRINEINERLSFLNKIKRKYGSTLEEVLKTYENLSNELKGIEISQDEIIKTENEIKFLEKELETLADKISQTREILAAKLSKAVTMELQKLELPKSRFEISISSIEMNEKGKDKVEFLISTNVSEDLKPIAQTASGGEISRIMLAIKTIFAQADKTNTVIFDEIDTGISGKASQSVADEILNLSKTHQIILITHQPIIAAKAASHFYVKKEQKETTKVNVYNLKDENRVKAIALLAAGEINEESSSFAKTLLGV